MTLLILVFQSLQAAETTYSFKCVAPKLSYIYKLNMTGEVTVYASAEEAGKVRINQTTFEMSLQKAGYNSKEEVLTTGPMKGSLKYVDDSRFTVKPYYQLSLLPKVKEENPVAHMNLLFNYPGKLVSSVRLKDGFTFKSSCELVEQKSCLFGDDLRDTKESERLIIKKDGQIFINSRVYEGESDFEPEVITHVQKANILDKKTKKEYVLYYTFEDEYDGGNTIGWFEDSKGNKVASIGDSDIYACKAYK